MQPHDDIRLRHMLESAKEAVKFAAGNSRKDLDEDRKLLLAIIKSIEIIGEAGVTEPLIYYYFSGKDELFTRLIENLA